jgi:hypothetical protein
MIDEMHAAIAANLALPATRSSALRAAAKIDWRTAHPFFLAAARRAEVSLVGVKP